jgi:hypothetical protein
MNRILGNKRMPQYVIDYVQSFMPENDLSIAIHKSISIAGYGNDTNKEKIERTKGFIGTNQLEKSKFLNAIHHFKIFYNQNNKARIFYRYIGNITFIKNLGNT